jgi:hypothetical protein
MAMETLDPIEDAIACLEKDSTDLSHPPAMIVLPPDSGKLILGYRGDFIRLAMASLRGARGEEQPFEGEPWVSIEDLDWSIAGLRPDPSAPIYLPTKPSRFQRLRSQIFGVFLVLLVSVCFVVGMATIVRWLFRHG